MLRQHVCKFSGSVCQEPRTDGGFHTHTHTPTCCRGGFCKPTLLAGSPHLFAFKRRAVTEASLHGCALRTMATHPKKGSCGCLAGGRGCSGFLFPVSSSSARPAPPACRSSAFPWLSVVSAGAGAGAGDPVSGRKAVGVHLVQDDQAAHEASHSTGV